MIKHAFLLYFFISHFICYAEYATLKEIPSQVFAENAKTTMDSIWITNFDLKSAVEQIYNSPSLLFHEGAISENPSNLFENYWNDKKDNWKAIRFQKSGKISVLFEGKVFSNDTKEYVEIYHPLNDKYELIWQEYGSLFAYHIQPYTKEIVLFQHKYPCCQSASHNTYRVRLINEKIHAKKRFFVGRDEGDMVGPFFPAQAQHDNKFFYLEKETILRWSPKIVDSNAFENRSHTNEIISYQKGSCYKILAQQNDWSFVLMFSGIMEKKSAVINYINFIHTPVYGWMKIEEQNKSLPT